LANTIATAYHHEGVTNLNLRWPAHLKLSSAAKHELEEAHEPLGVGDDNSRRDGMPPGWLKLAQFLILVGNQVLIWP